MAALLRKRYTVNVAGLLDRHRSKLIGIVAVVGFLLLLSVENRSGGPAVGVEGPAFDLAVLDEERTVSLQSLRGQPVVLDFWASWCGPCRQGLPKLQSVAGTYDGRVHFLTINSEDEPEDLLRSFRDGTRLTLPILTGGARTAASYGVRVIPTTVVLDAEGKVARTFTGVVSEKALAKVLDGLL